MCRFLAPITPRHQLQLWHLAFAIFPLEFCGKRPLLCDYRTFLSLPQVRTILVHFFCRNLTCSQCESLEARPFKILLQNFTPAWLREIRVSGNCSFIFGLQQLICEVFMNTFFMKYVIGWFLHVTGIFNLCLADLSDVKFLPDTNIESLIHMLFIVERWSIWKLSRKPQ